jgi:hypothetical protein
MEHLLFVPSTRLLDRIEYGDEIFHQYIGNGFGEVELTAGGQDLVMNGQCSWKEFTEALGSKIVWIGGSAYLDFCRIGGFGGILNYGRVLSVNADLESSGIIHVEVWAASIAQASTACQILYRLLTASGARMVENDSTVHHGFAGRPGCPFSGLALSQLIQQCPSLVHLALFGFTLNEEIVQALWAAAGTNVEIVLDSCMTTLSGRNALVESIRRNLGPIELLHCDIPIALLADGLRGNDSVKILKLHRDQRITEGDMRNLVQSLSQNQGLEELHFKEHAFSDENWRVLCQSIARHPALERMDASSTIYRSPDGNEILVPFSDTQKTRRTEMLVEMLKVNTVLHDITLMTQDYDQKIFHDEIRPRLLVNRYRPLVREIRTQDNDNSLRAKLLGWALHSVNTKPTILWMFLSSHKEHLLRGMED